MSNEKLKYCFCGTLINGSGNSTWGCWSDAEEIAGKGEHARCCDNCNTYVVFPARLSRVTNEPTPF